MGTALVMEHANALAQMHSMNGKKSACINKKFMS